MERHNIPGGCATSFVRGNFEFEVALHQLSGLGTEDKPFVMRKFFDKLGVLDKVEFIQEHALYRLVVPGELDVTLPASWSGIRRLLQGMYPAESEAIERFMLVCEKVTLESFMTLPQASRGNSEAMLRSLCPYYVQYGFRPAREVLDEFFADPKLKNILATYWLYLGVPPSMLPFADLATMLYAYAVFKPWHIKGGSQAMSNALVGSFLEAGGEVRFNCAVEKIHTEDGRICGVTLEGGERVGCDAVVSNASPLITFNEAARPAATAVEGPAGLQVAAHGHLGLRDLPRPGLHAAGAGGDHRLQLHLRDPRRGADPRAHGQPGAAAGRHAHLLQPGGPERRPEGKSQVVLVCLQYGDVWKSVKPEDYAQTKYAFAELIAVIEKVYPKVRQYIEEVEVATPLTMMRYLNTPGGAIYGFQQSAQDSALLRAPGRGAGPVHGRRLDLHGRFPAHLHGRRIHRPRRTQAPEGEERWPMPEHNPLNAIAGYAEAFAAKLALEEGGSDFQEVRGEVGSTVVQLHPSAWRWRWPRSSTRPRAPAPCAWWRPTASRCRRSGGAVRQPVRRDRRRARPGPTPCPPRRCSCTT